MTDAPIPDPAERKRYWEDTAEALGRAGRQVAERPELGDIKETLRLHAEAIELVFRENWQEIDGLMAPDATETVCSLCGAGGRFVVGLSASPPDPTLSAAEVCEECIELLHAALDSHRQRER